MKRRTAILTIAALVCLGIVGLIGMRQATIHRRTAAAAFAATVDAHSARIGSLLSVMANATGTEAEDAIFRELRTSPSTSLIARSDIRVEQVANASARRCVIRSRAAGMQRVVLASPPEDVNR
jgi:hypothetical protein